MFASLIGWPLLFLQFFLVNQREQLLAIQTILCAIVQPTMVIQIATSVILFEHLTPIINYSWQHMMLHHLIIAAAVLLEYVPVPGTKWVGCVCAAWSIYWLGASRLTPVRSCLRCLVFILLSNARKRWSDLETTSMKTVWILLVHEFAWCAIPIQMLYEIYSGTTKTLVVTV
jgi:hypothetical protein